jgi:hypothetical protein
MFDCQEDIMKGSADHIKRVLDFSYNWELHKGQELEENFSHDNWKMVCCHYKLFMPDSMHEIPLFGRHTWHPMNLIQFAWMKFWWLYPLRLISILDFIFNAFIVLKRDQNGLPHTSGRLLDLFVAHSYGMKWTKRLMIKGIEKNFENGVDSLFNIYYTQLNNKHIRDIYYETGMDFIE